MTKLLQEIATANAKLSVVPEDINAVGPRAWDLGFRYVDFNCYLNEVKKNVLPGVEAEALKVSDIFDVLKRASVRLDAGTKAQLAELLQGLAALRTQVQFAAYSVEGSTKRFQEELKAALPSVNHKLGFLREQTLNPNLYKADANMEQLKETLAVIRKQLEELTEEGFLKRLQRLAPCLGSQEVYQTLISSLNGFRDSLGVCKSLKNPSLKERHWALLQQLVGPTLNLRDPQLTLAEVTQVEELTQNPDILTLSSDATAEETLEGLLQSLQQTWGSLLLPLVSRNVNKDNLFILGPLEEVYATLEDSLVSVNTIAGEILPSTI
ncbi:hypothetical protein, conserved [Eimeria tenella]|uniref:Dynein heavy chain linker domain-containing protein n=1 Tax=Eimeria tenella TaxID=5802 RepID=U6L357_EIMTE|nr:hypothetical protein, conserved [Eimeria tenella]CDJ44837.1 hypothetical protein, conserved [Eimeria tenella]|eukprot:XP_013235585.1 hypothetical protein, conserved [Eimeria tenella]